MTRAQVGRLALLAWFVALWILAAVVCLSGCLTATKIHRWESALLGWARKGGPECVASAKVASKYLANANRTLAEAGKITDLASDNRARELMNSAALACGRRLP